jgi:hypothetical protein
MVREELFDDGSKSTPALIAKNSGLHVTFPGDSH